MAIIRVQHLRDLARRAPDTRLVELDRRVIGGIGMLPPMDAQLAKLRGEDVPAA
jgi:hypothetical protein